MCRCCGGIADRGSPALPATAGRVVCGGVCLLGRARGVLVAVSCCGVLAGLLKDTFRLFVLELETKGSADLEGDLVGLAGGLDGREVLRVVSHALSSFGAALNGRADCDRAKSGGFGVDALSGEPDGVAARTVEGERPSGDSGRRKGEARWLPKSGFMGPGEFDCEFIISTDTAWSNRDLPLWLWWSSRWHGVGGYWRWRATQCCVLSRSGQARRYIR